MLSSARVQLALFLPRLRGKTGALLVLCAMVLFLVRVAQIAPAQHAGASPPPAAGGGAASGGGSVSLGLRASPHALAVDLPSCPPVPACACAAAPPAPAALEAAAGATSGSTAHLEGPVVDVPPHGGPLVDLFVSEARKQEVRFRATPNTTVGLTPQS